MADISKEVKKFKEAAYGEDVRDAMVSAMEKINTVAENITSDAVQSYLDDHPEALAEAAIENYDILKGQVNHFVKAIGNKGETVLFQASTTTDNLWYSGQTITLSESYENYDYLDFYIHNLGREQIYRFKPDTATLTIRTVNVVDTATSTTDASMQMYETIIKLEEEDPFTTVTCYDANRIGWNGTSGSNASRLHFTSESDISNALRIFKIVGVTISDSNTELADIRYGADGVEYPTAGDAVREQFRSLTISNDTVTAEVESIRIPAEGFDPETPYTNAGMAVREQVRKLKQMVDGKADKVDGKGLSSNDFTTYDKQKLDSIEQEATYVKFTENLNQGKYVITTPNEDYEVPTFDAYLQETGYLDQKIEAIDFFWVGRLTATGTFPEWQINGSTTGEVIYEALTRGYIPKLVVTHASGTAITVFDYHGISTTVTGGDTHHNVIFVHDRRGSGENAVERLQVNYDGTCTMDVVHPQ